MTKSNPADILAALDELLDRERGALLAGDLDSLPELLNQKTTLIDALNALSREHSSMPEALRDKAVRNQALLDGALQGIRQVADRIAAIRKIRQSFETYDSDGRRRTIDADVVRKVEKRA